MTDVTTPAARMDAIEIVLVEILKAMPGAQRDNALKTIEAMANALSGGSAHRTGKAVLELRAKLPRT